MSDSFAFRTYRWEGFVFNVICAVYFLTLAPKVVDAGDFAMRGGPGTVVWLGILLITISLLEIYAFPTKMRFVREAAGEQGDQPGNGFWLWMFHCVISVILLFLIAGSFGVRIEGEDSEMPGWLGALIPVVVIKELIFLGFVFSMKEKKEDRKPDPRYRRPSGKEWLVDLILVCYACIVWSATWGAITEGMSMEREDPVMFVVNLFVSSLLFLIFYLPLRIPYWLEEMAQVKTAADAWKLAASVLIVLVPVIAMFR